MYVFPSNECWAELREIFFIFVLVMYEKVFYLAFLHVYLEKKSQFHIAMKLKVTKFIFFASRILFLLISVAHMSMEK